VKGSMLIRDDKKEDSGRGSKPEQLPREGGTYILIFFCEDAVDLEVGKSGKISLRNGFYTYAGSAFGSGGLASRVGRHVRLVKQKVWHIDYVRPSLRLDEVWLNTSVSKLECRWNSHLLELGGEVVLRKMGSSDCSCSSHFFFHSSRPNSSDFGSSLVERVTKLSCARQPDGTHAITLSEEK